MTNTLKGMDAKLKEPADPTAAPDGGRESTGYMGSVATTVTNGRATLQSSFSGVPLMRAFAGELSDRLANYWL